MARYEYYNSAGIKRTVQIQPPFERFHKCNAQHSSFLLIDKYEGVPRFQVKQFISYETRICQIIHDLKWDTYTVYLRGNPFRYSVTTSRQFSRWLYENEYYILVGDVRHAINNMHSVTPLISDYSEDNISIVMYDDYKVFDMLWR